MAATITPFLWFDGKAEEAANFYVSVFPDGEIVQVSRYTERGMGETGSVLTVNYRLQGQEFVAINGGPEFSFTEAVSFAIQVDTQAEIDHYWDALTAGGEPSQCGWLKDRYGLSWQVVPRMVTEKLHDPDRERVGRFTTAFLQMQKIDIGALTRAWDGA